MACIYTHTEADMLLTHTWLRQAPDEQWLLKTDRHTRVYTHNILPRAIGCSSLARLADRQTAHQIPESTQTCPSHANYWIEVPLPISKAWLPVSSSALLALSGISFKDTGPFQHQVKHRAEQVLSPARGRWSRTF